MTGIHHGCVCHIQFSKQAKTPKKAEYTTVFNVKTMHYSAKLKADKIVNAIS